MTLRICSGFSPEGHRQYGQRFLDSFDANWPARVELQVYVERRTDMPRRAYRDLWTVDGARECAKRYDDPMYRGIAPHDGWKEKERRARYSFRFDAAKFWKQILIPEAASAGLDDGDILVWLDADVMTTAEVPAGWVEELIGDAELVYLGREPKHSEIGFWAVRLNPQTRRFLHDIAEMYRDGTAVTLTEWHSAFVWDHVRRAAGLRERNLCPPGARGHVWPRSPLAAYTRHDKGKRKPGGRA